MWRRWFFAVVMLVARYAGAGVCTGVSDGAQCLLSDNVTAGTCLGGACTRTFTVPAGEARTGTGTISSSGGTVTGSGTAFTSELQVGDTLIAGGQRVAVTAIASNTSCSTVPAFNPAQSTASFTFANPILKFLDESGNTVGLVNARGLVAFGQTYTGGPLTVVGLTETAVGATGKDSSMTAGSGGPSDTGTNAGGGGTAGLTGGVGGNSAAAARSGGVGGTGALVGGVGGINTAIGGTGGVGGYVTVSAGSGGQATGSGGIGGAGADAVIQGGGGGLGITGSGDPGRVIVRGGGGFGAGGTGDAVICDNGGILKIGTSAQSQIDCSTGDFIKIRGVTLSAFPPANGIGFMKNNGGGTYTLSAVTMADLPAALRAFTQANAGGL